MPLLKEHLLFDHYSWDTQGSPYTGTPSRRLFNRYNGDQVLFVLNAYRSDMPATNEAEIKQLEEFLLHQLPLEPKSEISVLNWLKELKSISIE